MFRVQKQMYLALLLALVSSMMLLTPVYAQAVESPSDSLKHTSDEVIKVLKANHDELQKDPELVYKIVDKYILPHLDDVAMAKLALGKNWRHATREQKIAFVNEFRDLLIRTYSKSLQEFSDQKINFFPTRVEPNEDLAIVKSEVLQSSGPTIKVLYRVHLDKGDWKVYDITIDGLSLVTNYRGTFNEEIRKSGMDGLLKLMKDKNAFKPEKKSAES